MDGSSDARTAVQPERARRDRDNGCINAETMRMELRENRDAVAEAVKNIRSPRWISWTITDIGSTEEAFPQQPGLAALSRAHNDPGLHR